jgi:hypothetical protein
MKKVLILLLMLIAACNSPQSPQPENKTVNHNEHAVATVPLNAGHKWKVDEATRKNVAAMVQIVNDTIYNNAGKRKEFAASMQSQIDTLVKECTMQGPAHDALHIWLEKVLKDVKDLKEDKNPQTSAALAKDVKSFYNFFE